MTDVVSLYVNDGLPEEEIARQAALYGPLAEDIRALIPLGISSRADDDEIRRAREHLAAATEILERRRDSGPVRDPVQRCGSFPYLGG